MWGQSSDTTLLVCTPPNRDFTSRFCRRKQERSTVRSRARAKCVLMCGEALTKFSSLFQGFRPSPHPPRIFLSSPVPASLTLSKKKSLPPSFPPLHHSSRFSSLLPLPRASFASPLSSFPLSFPYSSPSLLSLTSSGPISSIFEMRSVKNSTMSFCSPVLSGCLSIV